jgi:hypothetical protein
MAVHCSANGKQAMLAASRTHRPSLEQVFEDLHLAWPQQLKRELLCCLSSNDCRRESEPTRRSMAEVWQTACTMVHHTHIQLTTACFPLLS